ncbi:sensor histidine kinase [Amycolatopsis sp. CA-230715]|uniref:sensor histidine kinase n=1 Tax=Amycolatopsis sp. CA-230715 TaxID=2745196 RepID=UPI001C0348B5|nr:ATP-binding protein [Amycolatopsis sp. CA-230715]
MRTRVLTIALTPSVVLLAAGVGINTYLLTGAVERRDTAALLSDGYAMAVPFMPAMSEERRASIAMAADPSPAHKAALEQARRGFTELMTRFGAISTQVADAMPAGAKASIQRFVATMPRIPALRQRIDSGQATRLEVYDGFSQVADAMIVAADAIGRDSADKDIAQRRSVASDLMRASDWLDRSNALAAAAVENGGLSPDELDRFTSLTRAYRADLGAIGPRLPSQQQRELDGITASADWALLASVENALIRQGFGARSPRAAEVTLPATTEQWQDAVRRTASAVSGMGLGKIGTAAAADERRTADDAVTRSVLIAAGSILLALLVLLFAVRMGNDLVRRLRLLRAETVEADERLPEVVARIRHGERVDVAAEVPGLDYGADELGEVAAAFTKAQRAAVAAAVQEAQLREGANAVFLNIARRSQVVVHRQLGVLDKAERNADDPDQVDLLYQLDHLSTRERRNAENLIILGGGKLTRQWHDAVPLIDVVRSAVAETEQYQRVTFGRLPELPVAGRAVADLVHLLAELVDNAIEFSPPESRIEMRGNPVGKGAVIEIDDQGLGMLAEDRERVNAMLGAPPDYGVMALTQDSRIGFFVVARLARQHDIRVTLMDSSYGGVRAVVLIPNSLIVVPAPEPEPDDERHTDWFGTAEDDKAAAGNGVAATETATPVATAPEPTRPTRHRADTAHPASRWPEPTDDHRPPLPRRRRQANLSPQLAEVPEQGRDPGDGGASAVEARDLMAAFQRGTRRGRADDTEPWDG